MLTSWAFVTLIMSTIPMKSNDVFLIRFGYWMMCKNTKIVIYRQSLMFMKG